MEIDGSFGKTFFSTDAYVRLPIAARIFCSPASNSGMCSANAFSMTSARNTKIPPFQT